METLDYICKKCGVPIEDIAEAMLEGCTCGSRLFKKGVELENEEVEEIQPQDSTPSESQLDDNIAIHVRQKGVYQLNLDNLTKRESDQDPIFVQDTKGRINVVFNPDA